MYVSAKVGNMMDLESDAKLTKLVIVTAGGQCCVCCSVCFQSLTLVFRTEAVAFVYLCPAGHRSVCFCVVLSGFSPVY